jgi:hypothetical protein
MIDSNFRFSARSRTVQTNLPNRRGLRTENSFLPYQATAIAVATRFMIARGSRSFQPKAIS